MSYQSWMDEFMPEAPDSLDIDNTLSIRRIWAMQHSLKKWKGLQAENIQKHDGILNYAAGFVRFSDGRLDVSADTCALCVEFLTDQHGADECAECPLYQWSMMRDLSHPCNRDTGVPAGDVPYSYWRNSGDPTMMINRLQDTLNWLLQPTEQANDTR